MANDLTHNPFIIDTPGAGVLYASAFNVLSIVFADYFANTDSFVIKDQNGNTFLSASGRSDLSPVVVTAPGVIDGLIVPTLTNGTISIYNSVFFPAIGQQNINSRVAYVQAKIGNRSDVDVKPWIRDSYIELAMNYDFEELLDTVTSVTKVSTPSNIFDTYDYPANVRAIKALTLIDSTGNTQVLERRSLRFIEAYANNIPSRPSIFAPYTRGSSTTTGTRTIILRSAPDAVYTLRWRAWMKPTIAGTLGLTALQMPDDWLEILDYGAAMRGFAGDLLEPDRAMAIFQLLFGRMDMKTGRKEPGMIAQRLTSSEYEYDDTYGAKPMVTQRITR